MKFGKVKKLNQKPDVSYTRANEGFLNMKIPHHKDGRPYSDVDMLELMGLRIMEDEEKQAQRTPNVPYIPKGYDPNLVTLAKEVAQARKEGMDETDISAHVRNVIIVK